MVSSEGEKGTNFTPCLPFDVIFQIFLHLPIEFLFECVRYVCKEWRNIIQDPLFIEAHLRKSKAGLLVHESSEPHSSSLIYEENGILKEKPLRLSFPGRPMDSCRGLCLFLGTARRYASLGTERKRDDNSILHVVNPVTEQIQELPFLGNGCYLCCHLAYIAQSERYKVVCCFSNSENSNWFVFTLGTDVSWRTLNAVTQDMLEGAVHPTSVTVGQFLYFSQGRRAVVAVNLHDETVTFIQTPNGFIHRSFWLLKKGDSLCCVARQGIVVHTWVLRVAEECEWIKDGDYHLTARNILHLPFSPLGWLDNGQIFISESRRWTCLRRSVFLVDFAKTGKFQVIGFTRRVPFYGVLIHTNSLVRW